MRHFGGTAGIWLRLGWSGRLLFRLLLRLFLRLVLWRLRLLWLSLLLCLRLAGSFLRGFLGRLRFNREKRHFEDQGGVRADCSGSALAIGEIGRNEQLPLGADGHQL